MPAELFSKYTLFFLFLILRKHAVQEFGEFVGVFFDAGEAVGHVFVFVAELSGIFLQRGGSLHNKNLLPG